MNKPFMMRDETWDMMIRSDGGSIKLVEKCGGFRHPLGDITEECIRAVLHYGTWKAEELGKDRAQFSHPCSDWLIEVRKKKEPRYKRLFNSFKK